MEEVPTLQYPEDYLYSKEHEWIRVEEGDAVLGITHYAQVELGDIVFVELPEMDEVFESEDELGTIESVKAVAEIYTPVGGTVIGVNERLEDSPELLNQDPHSEGWLVRIRMSKPDEIAALMSAAEYRDFLGDDEG